MLGRVGAGCASLGIGSGRGDAALFTGGKTVRWDRVALRIMSWGVSQLLYPVRGVPRQEAEVLGVYGCGCRAGAGLEALPDPVGTSKRPKSGRSTASGNRRDFKLGNIMVGREGSVWWKGVILTVAADDGPYPSGWMKTEG